MSDINLTEERKIYIQLNKYDIIYVVLVTASVFFLLFLKIFLISENGTRAVVKYGGKEIMALDLKKDRKVVLKKKTIHYCWEIWK